MPYVQQPEDVSDNQTEDWWLNELSQCGKVNLLRAELIWVIIKYEFYTYQFLLPVWNMKL